MFFVKINNPSMGLTCVLVGMPIGKRKMLFQKKKRIDW